MDARLAFAVKTEKLQFTLDEMPIGGINTDKFVIAANEGFDFIGENSLLSSKSHVLGINTPGIQ